MTQPITDFKGVYAFMSNFYWSQLQMGLGDALAPTVEHAFQAEKMTTPEARAKVLACVTPGGAKNLARSLPKRSDWEDIKTQVMLYYVRQKFTSNAYLRNLLAATGDRYLIEGNTWADRCWGAVFEGGQWIGENRLGLILMQVRKELQ